MTFDKSTLSSTENVLVERIGGTMLVTINRPDRANAIDIATSRAVDAAVTEAEADERIQAIVITGAGDRAFCAGMDLKEAAAVGAGKVLLPGSGLAGISQRRSTKPMIAAVNGAAIGGGFEIMLACDIVVAHEDAIFGLPEVKRGLFAFAGGVQRLAQRLARSVALELILLGDALPARRLYELGVISFLVPPEKVVPHALEVAERIGRNSPAAISAARDLYEFSAIASLPDAFGYGLAKGKQSLSGGEAVEGIGAFSEKRVPRFDLS